MFRAGQGERLVRLTRRNVPDPEPPPLLVELFERPSALAERVYHAFPFGYRVTNRGGAGYYEAWCLLPQATLARVRAAVSWLGARFEPSEVEPLSFGHLVEVLEQRAAELLVKAGTGPEAAGLTELAAYEAIGLSRLLALAKDDNVTEFFVDSDSSPVYLDHAKHGRCETGIMLTERERKALETHLDTFGGYTADFRTPSLKNELVVAGATLRVSLDLEPVSVNRFALDVRRLSVVGLSMKDLITLHVVSAEAASLLVGWLETGGNVTIVGETGTGKTTLLNALDEEVEPRLRRLYIEDAVETKDLLGRGYHQLKVKVDPLDRGGGSSRTKESEIIKALHRSPDLVILSEIQSEEHSRAFFHSLSAGARGMQTFHASSAEQAIGRWMNIHHVPEKSLLDLGLIVQMSRPDRLRQERLVSRVCAIVAEAGAPRLKELFMRDRESRLRRVADLSTVVHEPPGGSRALEAKVAAAERRLSVVQGPQA